MNYYYVGDIDDVMLLSVIMKSIIFLIFWFSLM